MKNVNKICMSVFMLGATAIAAPAWAQAADAAQGAAAEGAAAVDKAATDTAAKVGETADKAAEAVTPAKSDANESAAPKSQTADANTSAGPAAASGNSQIAMNSSGATAAANANVSSMGDTSKKYHRASRGKDFAAEQKVTQQLNQMASNAAKPGVQTAMNQ